MEHSIFVRRHRLVREQEQLNKMEMDLEQQRARLSSQGNRTLGVEPVDRSADKHRIPSPDGPNGAPPLPPRNDTSLALSSSSTSVATVLPGSHGSSVVSLPNADSLCHDGTSEQSTTVQNDADVSLELDDAQDIWQTASPPAGSSNESEASWASIHPPTSNASERSFNSIQTPSSPSRLSESSFSYVTDDDDEAHNANHIQ